MNKSRLFCLVLVSLAVIVAFSGSVDAQEQKVRFGVMSFENSARVDEGDGGATFSAGMADILIRELSKGNRNYEIIGRAQLDKTFAEMAGKSAGAFDEAVSREIGKALGLDYVAIGNLVVATIGVESVVNTGNLPGFLGRIANINAGTAIASVVVNIKVIDVGTGKPVISEMSDAKQEMGASVGIGGTANTVTMGGIESVASEAIAKVANQIKRRIAPMEYTVLQVKKQAKDGEVVIDMGRDDGANVGLKYKIKRKGEVLTNPRTGEIVGIEEIEIANITITSIDDNMSTAKIYQIYQGEIIDAKGKSKKAPRTIERGDIVKLIE